ncbi:SPFH domain-containing protein [Desulfatiferula olefinivorans]
MNDDDQVVITQFGKIIGEAVIVPGEYFKVPFIQKVHYFKKNFFLSESMQEIPTRDKEYIKVQSSSFYKISDPIAYYKKLNSYNLAKDFVLKHTGSAEREIVTSNTLVEIFKITDSNQIFENANFNPILQYQIRQMAKKSIKNERAGVELCNFEAKVSYPIDSKKP